MSRIKSQRKYVYNSEIQFVVSLLFNFAIHSNWFKYSLKLGFVIYEAINNLCDADG